MSAPLKEHELDYAAGCARRDADRARVALDEANLARRLVDEVRELRERDAAWRGATGAARPEDLVPFAELRLRACARAAHTAALMVRAATQAAVAWVVPWDGDEAAAQLYLAMARAAVQGVADHELHGMAIQMGFEPGCPWERVPVEERRVVVAFREAARGAHAALSGRSI